jgi:hypothetical protein
MRTPTLNKGTTPMPVKTFSEYTLDGYNAIRRQQQQDTELFNVVFARLDKYEERFRDKHRVTRLSPTSGELSHSDTFVCGFRVVAGKIFANEESFSEVEKAIERMGGMLGAVLVTLDDAEDERRSDRDLPPLPTVRVAPKPPLYPV